MDISTATQHNLLTVDQADERVRNNSRIEDGAIEDCEVEDASVTYFFETGTIATVCRTTGSVTITEMN
jgi:hypothetical protein